MNSMRLFVSESHDPYINLAFEEHLFRGSDEAAFLWVNGPCVVIGRNQDPTCEADLAFLQENGIALARRLSGGGAVYHDLGNVNYSLVTDDSDSMRLVRWALATLALVGISARACGRNDIHVGTRKVGGMAECHLNGRSLLHGTIMVDVDLANLARALQPSPSKLERHGIASVEARVANLTDAAPSLTVAQLIDAFATTLDATALPAAFSWQIHERAKALKEHAWLFHGIDKPIWDNPNRNAMDEQHQANRDLIHHSL